MANPIITNDAIVQNILDGKQEFLSLDFATGQGVECALRCLDSRPLLSRMLNSNDPAQREVLKVWIERKYSNLILLNVEQRHKDLVDVYLEKKYTEQLKAQNNPFAKSVSIIHSYTKQQIICYDYVTKEGEAVCYFDEVLGVPVKLKTQAEFKIKLIDALKLVEAIDVELNCVDLGLTVNFINNKITDCLRETLLGLIDSKKTTYYDLPRYFGEIKHLLSVNLQKVFLNAGLIVADIDINDISITNNASEKLENQYFALAEIARVKEFENKMEEASLKFYEKKAMIHEKYPNFQMGLTETEKDLALNRYLKRVGKEKEIVANIKDKPLDNRPKIGPEVTKAVVKEEMPVAPSVNKKWRTLYIVCGIAWLIISVLLTAIEMTRIFGIALLVIGAAAYTALGIVFRYEIRYGVRKKEQLDYERKLNDYQKRKTEYETHKPVETAEPQSPEQN